MCWHDRVMTAPNTESATATPDSPDEQSAVRAARQALAAQQARNAAARWLTSDRITVLGQQLALSIEEYRHLHQQFPTWAEALAGVDPALLAPIQAVPDGWPLRPARWRLELREHLMTELKRTRWVTYTRAPRSLHPGDHGRGWLRTGHPTGADTSSVP
jgi:hypothetical protein